MQEVTHKQIYDRLIEVEKKVDDIDRHTVEIRDAFTSLASSSRVRDCGGGGGAEICDDYAFE